MILVQLFLFFASLILSVDRVDNRLLIMGCVIHAQTTSERLEVYSSRPSILQLKSQSLVLPFDSTLTQEEWTALKRAQFAAAIEILSLYPDRSIYFLGRDAEMIFDAAQLVANPEQRRRIHLINVSRANMNSNYLLDYLSENGISEEKLKVGKQIIFFDTGFAGTIPYKIKSHFPQFQDQFKTHLILSGNSSFPSSRSFLIELNPATNDISLSNANGTILNYEHLPRYTDRSNEYKNVDGKWEAVSRTSGSSDGVVNKKIALEYMKDLKYSFENDTELKIFIRAHKLHWKRLQLILNKVNDPAQLKAALTHFLNVNSSLSKSQKESLLRDLFEAKVNSSPLALQLNDIKITEIGLTETIVHEESQKLAMAKKYPQWKAVLTDPITEVPKLVLSQDFGTLAAILDAVSDFEIRSIIIKELGQGEITQKKKNLLQALIEKNNYELDWLIVSNALNTFSESELRTYYKVLLKREFDINFHGFANSILDHRNFANLTDLFKEILNHVDPKRKMEIASKITYGQSISQIKKNLAFSLLDSGDPAIIQGIGNTAFLDDKTTDRRFWLKFIAVANQAALASMAAVSFRSGNLEFKREFMRMIIKKGDQEVLKSLLYYSFMDNSSVNFKNEIKLIAMKADTETAREMAKSFFREAISSEHVEALDILVKKNDKSIWNTLRAYVFFSDHSIAFKNQILYIIQNGDPETLNRMKEIFRFNPFLDNRKLMALVESDPDWMAMKKSLDLNDIDGSANNCRQAVSH